MIIIIINSKDTVTKAEVEKREIREIIMILIFEAGANFKHICRRFKIMSSFLRLFHACSRVLAVIFPWQKFRWC